MEIIRKNIRVKTQRTDRNSLFFCSRFCVEEKNTEKKRKRKRNGIFFVGSVYHKSEIVDSIGWTAVYRVYVYVEMWQG